MRYGGGSGPDPRPACGTGRSQTRRLRGGWRAARQEMVASHKPIRLHKSNQVKPLQGRGREAHARWTDTSWMGSRRRSFDRAEAGGRGWKGEPRPRNHGPWRGHGARRRAALGRRKGVSDRGGPFELEASQRIPALASSSTQEVLTHIPPACSGACPDGMLTRTSHTGLLSTSKAALEQAPFTCRGTQSHACCNFPRHWKTVFVVSCSFTHVPKGASVHEKQVRGVLSHGAGGKVGRHTVTNTLCSGVQGSVSGVLVPARESRLS